MESIFPRQFNMHWKSTRKLELILGARHYKLEMLKIMSAVKILDSIEAKPIGYQQIPCHIIFDVKMDFTRKA